MLVKRNRLNFSSSILAVLIIGFSPWSGWTQSNETHSASGSAAPTGTYGCDLRIWVGPLLPRQPGAPPLFPGNETNKVPLFTLRLETNGTYVATSAVPHLSAGIDGYGVYSFLDEGRGTWLWDSQKREFLLTPVPGTGFTWYLARLPLDKRDSNRLVCGSSFLERQERK